MSFSDQLGVAGIVVGVLGLVVAVVAIPVSVRLARQRRRLGWSDLQSAANDLSRKIKKLGTPAAVLTPGLTGATFANLLVSDFKNQPPVYVGTRTWLTEKHGRVVDSNSWVFTTKKWFITVPKTVLDYQSGMILVVDDFAMSGDFLEELKKVLISSGVAASRIKTATIAVTRVAIRNHKQPDFYWWTAEDDDFYFPWGKAR